VCYQYIGSYDDVDPISLCKYNYKCLKPILGWQIAFNNIYTNVGYLIVGGVFTLFSFMVHRIRTSNPYYKYYGVYDNISIYMNLGLSICLVGVFSTLYHICPTPINYQFDTSFMFYTASFLLLGVYYKRHDPADRPLLIYTLFAFFILWNFVATVTNEPYWFWGVTWGIHFFF